MTTLKLILRIAKFKKMSVGLKLIFIVLMYSNLNSGHFIFRELKFLSKKCIGGNSEDKIDSKRFWKKIQFLF